MKNSDFLGKEKISKLLIKMSAPAIVGMLAMSLYNLVDTIFIGRSAGMLGIAGIVVTFPITMLMMGVFQAIGAGSASIISRALGANDVVKGEKVLGNYLFLLFVICIPITILGVLFMKPMLIAFGASVDVLPYASDYLHIMFIGTLFLAFASSGNNIIRAVGNAKLAMIVMLSVVVINIILDPIFIFTFGWGIKGAAWASVASMVVAGFIMFGYFVTGQVPIKFQLKYLKIFPSITKEVFAVGVSSFARMATNSIMILVLNNYFGRYGGDVAIAAFGLIFRLIMITMMIVNGIIQGLMPIVGYNYGAKNYQRVLEAIILSIKAIVLFSTFVFILLFFFPVWFMSIFTSDKELIQAGAYGMRFVILFWPLVGVQLVSGGIYQAMGKSMPAFILSIMRQILFLIPLIMILSIYRGLNGIWLSFPISDFLAIIITFWFIIKEYQRLKARI